MRLIAVSLFCFAAATHTASAQVRQLSLADLALGADRIVVGGVSKLVSRVDGQKIVTDVTIAPLETLKGEEAPLVVFTIPGGTIGNVGLRASEAPDFVVGEVVVVFLKGGTPCDVYGWFRGKYTVVNGNIRELVNTSLEVFRHQIQQVLR